MERLRKIGSDHFPILVELTLEPAESWEQPPPKTDPEEEKEAEETIEEAEKAAENPRPRSAP